MPTTFKHDLLHKFILEENVRRTRNKLWILEDKLSVQKCYSKIKKRNSNRQREQVKGDIKLLYRRFGIKLKIGNYE